MMKIKIDIKSIFVAAFLVVLIGYVLLPKDIHAQSFTANNANIQPRILFSDDFTGSLIDTSKWVPANGWSQNNVLTVNGGGIGYTKKSDFRNFTLDVDFQIMPHNGYEYAAFILRQEPNNPFVGTYYMVQIGSKTSFATPNEIRISKGIDLVTTIPISFDINTNQWYQLKLIAKGYNFKFWIDNQSIGEWIDSTKVNSGGVRMRRWGAIGINAAGVPGDPLSDLVNYDNLVVSNPH